MDELVNGLTLYHGSYCEVKEPQLDKCAKRKDFGKGFYLTSSKEQAISFLNTSIAKAITIATNTTLAAYIAGAYGTMGSKEADEFCIRQLLPEKLKDQLCFKTVEALECLHFVEGEKVWLKK